MNALSRRQFIKKTAAFSTAATIPAIPDAFPSEGARTEARYYQKLEARKVRCELCPWRCVVEPGERGHCDVRENRNGIYYSLVYGKIASNNNDPIEKKPFFHVLPGTFSFSIATAGCNVDCKFCQNWTLAQRRPEEVYSVDFQPEDIVRFAGEKGSKSIAFTYNEPTVFAEFIVDTARLAAGSGLKSVVVSNGFINPAPLSDLCSVLHAYKIDLKSFRESYYRDIVGGQLKPVLETLVTLKSRNIWTEMVYLVLPTLNDSDAEVREMVQWISKELGPEVPVHFSRFTPQYKLMNLPPTPIPTLERLRNIALDGGLHYVYLGNVPGHAGENTVCPSCQKTLIRRIAYVIYENHVSSGKCGYCGRSIPGIWS